MADVPILIIRQGVSGHDGASCQRNKGEMEATATSPPPTSTSESEMKRKMAFTTQDCRRGPLSSANGCSLAFGYLPRFSGNFLSIWQLTHLLSKVIPFFPGRQKQYSSVALISTITITQNTSDFKRLRIVSFYRGPGDILNLPILREGIGLSKIGVA